MPSQPNKTVRVDYDKGERTWEVCFGDYSEVQNIDSTRWLPTQEVGDKQVIKTATVQATCVDTFYFASYDKFIEFIEFYSGGIIFETIETT